MMIIDTPGGIANYRALVIERALIFRAETGQPLMRQATLTRLRQTDPEKIGNARTYKQAAANWSKWVDNHIRAAG